MNIKRIDLVFENCEVVSLNNDMYKNLILDDITEQRIVNCYQYKNGENETKKCSKYMSIDINKKGYEQKTNWQKITLKERLEKWNDITYINLIYEDNSEESIFVLWDEEDEYNNDYQKVIRLDKEMIRVTIEKKKSKKYKKIQISTNFINEML